MQNKVFLIFFMILICYFITGDKNKMITKLIIKKITKECKQQQLTINSLAKKSQLRQSTLNSIMNGESNNPRIETIAKICNGLNLSIGDFFSDEVFIKNNS